MAGRGRSGKMKRKAARPPTRRAPARPGGGRGASSRRALEQSLAEALEQQAATSNILKVISGSPTALQPVLDAVVENAARFCGADDASLFRVEGDRLRGDAHHGPVHQPPGFQLPLARGSLGGRTALERRTIHVADLQAETEEFPEASVNARRFGFRSALSVPLVRDGVAIGVIQLRRSAVSPFSDKQIGLLQTFADQAVIAIENVRLLTELGARNRELTDSLTQQTATAEILRAISSSPADLQPVLDTVVESAARYCGATDAQIWQRDGEGLRLVAHHGPLASPMGRVIPVVPETVTGRSVLERRAIHVADIRDAAGEFPWTWARARELAFRATLIVPLMREGAAIGALQLRRGEARPFTDKQTELLHTFADQAVIAIENVRLFTEIEDKSRQLEAASRHKSEFLANMSHELRTPLNAVIGFSEVLIQRMFGELTGKQEEYLKDIYASGQHLLSLINDILDLSKIEAGRMELALADFDLPDAVENVLILMRERAARRGVTLARAVDERLATIRADERKVKQVLLNLLSNALKFTPEGGRIDVRATLRDDAVEIAVTDTGIGIAPEDHEAVFEEFRQVGTASRTVEGTGLGLALSRKFVSLHGGRIWVESAVGRGATFTLTLPLGGPPALVPPEPQA